MYDRKRVIFTYKYYTNNSEDDILDYMVSNAIF